MSETLSGVKTIRAFGLENDFISVNNRKIDVNTSVMYCNIAANRWLSVRLESVSGSVVSCAALFAVLQKGNVDPGFAGKKYFYILNILRTFFFLTFLGLSIVYALQLTNMLNGMVRNYSLVETNLISVERVIKYSELPTEAPPTISSKKPAENWPQSGAVEFKNVQLRYREGLDLVLKDTTFEVKPQEKIGIVGRTGAGNALPRNKANI
jgi:ATP-binding cassette subfamily C (CFTR/MRP) protein 1